MIRATEAIGRYLICALALALAVAAKYWIAPVNATTAALYMLLVVLAAATRWGLAESIFTSIAAVFGLNFGPRRQDPRV